MISLNCGYKYEDDKNIQYNRSLLSANKLLNVQKEKLFIGKESIKINEANLAVINANDTKSNNDIVVAKEKIAVLQSKKLKEELSSNIVLLEHNIHQNWLVSEANRLFNLANVSKKKADVSKVEEVIIKISSDQAKEDFNKKITTLKNEIEEIKRIEEEKKKQEEKLALEAQYAKYNNYMSITPPSDGEVIERIVGSVSAFSPFCQGCGGYVAAGQDVRNGNIYYYDPVYGSLRIVAGDSSYPFGTIVRFNNLNGNVVHAIVLDRGGAIGKNRKRLWDLLFSSEEQAYGFGVAYDVECDILRLGY